MLRFLLRRLLHGVFVVWGVVTAVFFLVRLTGDPAVFLVDQSATRTEIEHTRHLLGLDRSLPEQYGAFLLAAPRGDFGESIRSKQPATASSTSGPPPWSSQWWRRSCPPCSRCHWECS